jgi:hypothetical protein
MIASNIYSFFEAVTMFHSGEKQIVLNLEL